MAPARGPPAPLTSRATSVTSVTTSRSASSRRWLPPAAFALATGGVVLAATVMALSMREETRRRAGAELDAVAALKVAAVEEWRENHRKNARYATGYPAVARAARAAERGPLDAPIRAHLVEILSHLAVREGYLRVAVLSAQGRVLVEWARAGGPSDPLADGLLRAALAGPGDVADALRADAADRPYLDVVAAIRADGAPPCAIALRVDATALFHDVLEGWPVPSRTAHAGLVVAGSDDVRLFLPRREAAPGGHPVRMQLTQHDRPAVKAAGGVTGVLRAIDRHGVPVLVAIRAIPGTDWKLRTKVALDEIDAATVRPARAIAALVAALLAAGTAMLVLWWRQESTRAAMEVRLREGQERFELALSDSHRILDWDLAAGRLEIHPTAASEPSTISGGVATILARLVHPDDLAGVCARIEAHLHGDTPAVESEHRLPPEGAEARWVLVRGRVGRRDGAGRPLRFTGVVTEVTERRAMQARLELAQRMAGLGTLAAGVAHEINNPLASLSANLDFLAVGELAAGADPEIGAALSEARDGADRVRDVVRGLQAFSRPGAGGRAPTDVQAELEAAIRLAHNQLRHRARVEVRIGELPRVEAGGHELGQVFVNLLVNAAQAIPEGRADEHVVAVVADTDPEGRARVEISDTGTGIPTEVLARIFDPFFTTKRGGLGTGLGLAIAHRIVTGLGGRIEVESQVGRGTTFRVTLPAASAAPETAPGRPPSPAARVPRHRLLVVDDDALVLRAVVRTLSAGYAVESAASGPDALARLERGERFDVVLCDLMMPQMTGMELHALVAARDPELAGRMVFITGGAFSDAASRFLEETRNRCLEKPFDAARLRAALEAALAGGRDGASRRRA